MWGIPQFSPSRYRTSSALIHGEGERLRSLIGQQLTSAWGLIDDEGSWWCDGPVVFQFEHTQLDVSVSKLDELLVAWSTVVLKEEVRWGGGDGPRLRWAHGCLAQVEPFLGARLHAIDIAEYRYTTAGISLGESIATTRSAWLLNGLRFGFGPRHLTLHNALDENALTADDAAGSSLRFLPLSQRK